VVRGRDWLQQQAPFLSGIIEDFGIGKKIVDKAIEEDQVVFYKE
jgi:hypothetical protein